MTHYANEKEMYEPVRLWLDRFLKDKFRRSEVKTFVVATSSLVATIRKENIPIRFAKHWQTWDVYVDVVGFVIQKSKVEIALVECKNANMTLGHLSQLLGYSIVVNPMISFLLSPIGMSDSLRLLLVNQQRTDVLIYGREKGQYGRGIIIAKWDSDSETVDWATVIMSSSSLFAASRA